MSRRHARAVAPALSRALTTPHASHALTCLGRRSACLGSSARSVRARLRRWMMPGRVVLRARRGKSLMRRRRGVSTAMAIDTQRLEFVKIVYHPMSSLGIVRRAAHLYALQAQLAPKSPVLVLQIVYNVHWDQYRVVVRVNRALSLAREPTTTKRHARAVAPGPSRAPTKPPVSHAPTCPGQSSACSASSARSVRVRLRRWMRLGRVALHAQRGRSRT